MRTTVEHPEERPPAPIGEVIARLKEAYPDARTELDWENPLQLLVATGTKILFALQALYRK